MKNILIIGAGRSSRSLIHYLLEHAAKNNWQLRVADRDIALAREKTDNSPHAEAMALDVENSDRCLEAVRQADLVISLLPAYMHHKIAEKCVREGRHMLTASYVSPEIQALDAAARKKGVLLLMETGLDPGIDHMSAMQEIDAIREAGGTLTAFKSFTGGLVAPESDNNPWNYKFTWNPRNVVVAGQGVARFVRNGRYKYIPYHNLFNRLEKVTVPGWGDFEGYANRDSLGYREAYGLETIPTLFRGTLRRPGFCAAWQVLVQLGMTDDSYLLEDVAQMTYRDFTNAYLAYRPDVPVETKLCDLLQINRSDPRFKKFAWLGLFEHTKIGLKKATPAQVLQRLLEEKWALADDDKDMIVMQHQLEYELEGKPKKRVASMVVTGKNAQHTAMAATVGWPLGMAARLVLEDKITLSGVQLPLHKAFYAPILEELTTFGVRFDREEQ